MKVIITKTIENKKTTVKLKIKLKPQNLKLIDKYI